MGRGPTELGRLLAGAARGEVAYAAFARALRGARLLLPMDRAKGLPPGPHPVGDPAALRLLTAEREGVRCFLAFTSAEAMGAGLGSPAPYVELGAPTVFTLLRGEHLLLDHGGPASKHIPPTEMELLLRTDFEPSPADLLPVTTPHGLFARSVGR